MNEFAARKLGEVLAFSQVGVETFQKGYEAFKAGLPDHDLDGLIKGLQDHAEEIQTIAKEAGMADVTDKKAEATGQKLRSMRELYVGDEWDNPTELLEWSGFFEGAALVHWALVEGAGHALNNDELMNTGTSGREFHEDLLDAVSDALHHIGEQKAVQPR